MARLDILTLLEHGDSLLLDGATGSELQHRGVNMARGTTSDGGLGAWSATAVVDAPEILRDVHRDYLAAGADIITTNSFWTNRFRLSMVGEQDNMVAYTRKAAEIACSARDEVNRDAYVAGSIAPPLHQVGDLFEEYRDQTAVLADSGVDLILIEYVGSIAEALPMLRASRLTGLPVFLGICEITPAGTMQSGETVEQLLTAVQEQRPDAILAMCSLAENISVILPKLRVAYDGPIGGYPQLGYDPNPEFGKADGGQWHVLATGEYTPERLAQFCRAWLDMGAQIVGGCCCTRPEHIAAMRPVIPKIR